MIIDIGGNQMEDYANIFKVLSDVNRIKVLDLLVKGEKCSCTLIDKLPISQPTLSYHLKMLHEVGLIRNEKVGNRVNHYVIKEKVQDISDFLNGLLDGCVDGVCKSNEQ